MAMKTLKTRILGMVSALLFLISGAVLIAVWLSTDTHVKDQIRTDLEVGSRVLERLLESREQQLINSVEVLTADFGFKQAVATGDSPTIRSALKNHGQRINADLMALLTLEGKVQATTSQALQATQDFPYPALVTNALNEGGTATIIQLGGALYQIILLPVRAPIPIGIAVTGFRINTSLANELKQLTHLDISFVSHPDNKENPVTLSTLPTFDYRKADAPPAKSLGLRIPFTDSQQLATQALLLAQQGNAEVKVYLTASIDEIFAEFDVLQLEIVLITFAALSLALISGVIFARNLTRPLLSLAQSAQRIAKGDYKTSLDTGESTQEITDLSTSFKSMLTSIQEREERITFQATHDPLTGSLNRQQLLHRFREFTSERASCHLSLVCLNIKDFRNINDTFGYGVGDACLIEIHHRLEEENNGTLIFARVGADEFIAILKNNGTPEHSVNKLQAVLETPYNIEGLDVNLAFAYGVAVYPTDDQTPDNIIQKASVALDVARRDHSTIEYYSPGLEERRKKQLCLMNDLKTALIEDDGQLSMHFQPKLCLKTNEIRRFEALIRWTHPKEGFVSPEMFIPLAEQAGLIERLTDWVVASVIRQLNQWKTQGFELQIAVNLSARDLSRQHLLDMIHSMLSEFELSPHSIAFEITESDVMDDPKQAIELLKKFRTCGFDLAIDDFGTGYSSLSQLKNMPVTDLKIDKSFVMELNQRQDDQIIVRSTLDLAHNFDLEVIAEGVENEESLRLLQQWGCDWAQGYYISRPMPAGQVMDWLKNYQRPSTQNSLAGS